MIGIKKVTNEPPPPQVNRKRFHCRIKYFVKNPATQHMEDQNRQSYCLLISCLWTGVEIGLRVPNEITAHICYCFQRFSTPGPSFPRKELHQILRSFNGEKCLTNSSGFEIFLLVNFEPFRHPNIC